jgi:hypothetical protein
MVVPIFAPIITKIPISREMVPDATIATAIDVTVELLWINAVVRSPINKEMNGISAILINSWAAPRPIDESA